MKAGKKLFNGLAVFAFVWFNLVVINSQIFAQEKENYNISQNPNNQNNDTNINETESDANAADPQKTSNDSEITVNQIDKANFENIAILQGLNKITAKTSEFNVKVGEKIEFGKLTIIVHKCWQSPLDQSPESKMLIEIFETDTKNVKNRIFYGWMFSSTPSISGLEHPIYDVTAIGCKSK